MNDAITSKLQSYFDLKLFQIKIENKYKFCIIVFKTSGRELI